MNKHWLSERAWSWSKLNEKEATQPHERTMTLNAGEGRAAKKGFKIADADPEELKKGIEVEKEHTSDEVLATRIALDHLSELRSYYTELAKMEGKKQ